MAPKKPDNNRGRRRQSPPPSLRRLCRIPDDVLCGSILPRLPFKSLSRFAAVSKSWRSFIRSGGGGGGGADGDKDEVKGEEAMSSFNPLLAIDQPKHPSPASVAFVRLSIANRLSFLPSASSSSVGVPDPSLSFIPDHYGIFLAAAANGLLCLLLSLPSQPHPSLYVVNPATMRGELVPGCTRHIFSAGLAFDPSTSPDRYVLVVPHLRTLLEGSFWHYEYNFDAFSSDTGRWVESEHRVRVYCSECGTEKPVYVDGIIYWDCCSTMLWYDVNSGTAGRIWRPDVGFTVRSSHNVGVHNGRLAYAQAWEGGLAIYALRDRPQSLSRWKSESEWTKIHEKTWGAMIAEDGGPGVGGGGVFDFCHGMQPRNGAGPGERLFLRWSLSPMAIGGGKVYLGVKPLTRRGRKVTKILCYDFMTGKMEEDAGAVRYREGRETSSLVFDYHNSMVALPEIKLQRQN